MTGISVMIDVVAFFRYKKLIKKIDQRFSLFLANISIWDKVFKNGPSKICGRQPLSFFKGCLPQILLGPFLNTLSHFIPPLYSLAYSLLTLNLLLPTEIIKFLQTKQAFTYFKLKLQYLT